MGVGPLQRKARDLIRSLPPMQKSKLAKTQPRNVVDELLRFKEENLLRRAAAESEPPSTARSERGFADRLPRTARVSSEPTKKTELGKQEGILSDSRMEQKLSGTVPEVHRKPTTIIEEPEGVTTFQKKLMH